MMRTVRMVFLIACVGCDVAAERDSPTPVPSARAAPAAACDSASTTLAQLECAAADLATAERALTLAVDSVRARGASAILIDSAQAAWTQSRRHDCALAGAAYAGGSLEGVEVAACMARLTRQRAMQVGQLFRVP